MKRIIFWAAAVLIMALVIGNADHVQAQQKSFLTSESVSSGPKLDGVVDDMWSKVPALAVNAVSGKNLPAGKTTVNLRSVHTADHIYFLIQYADATHSQRRSPWVMQKDGSWKMLKDPADKGGDNNLYYEDKFSFLWNIGSPEFEKSTFSAGHIGDGGKPYGTMYTKDGGLLDMWHWKSVRTGPVGQVDDQYMDGTLYDKAKSPEAGRKSDPKTGGGYADNMNSDKTGPKFAPKGQKTAPPYWILDSEKEPIDSSKYKEGDEVPGIVVAPFTGDRGDILAEARWENGVWTIEMSRKLVTGSKYDVQFDDLGKEYAFGVAVFDNAQVRHAFSTTSLWMNFKK